MPYAYAILFRSDAADLRERLDSLPLADGPAAEVVAFDLDGTAADFDRLREVFGWEATERILGSSVVSGG